MILYHCFVKNVIHVKVVSWRSSDICCISAHNFCRTFDFHWRIYGEGCGRCTPSPFGRRIVPKKLFFYDCNPHFWSAPDKYSHEGLQLPPPFSRVSRSAFWILWHFIVNGISHIANTRYLKSLIFTIKWRGRWSNPRPSLQSHFFYQSPYETNVEWSIDFGQEHFYYTRPWRLPLLKVQAVNTVSELNQLTH